MSERLPSLHVYRRVLNINHQMLNALLQSAERSNIPVPRFNSFDLHASLVNPGELRAFYCNVEYDVDEDTVNGLGNHLEDYLPASTDHTISVPTLPASIFRAKRRPNQRFITIGTNNPTVQTERITAQALVRSYLQTPDADFLENDTYTHARIGKYSYDPEGSAASAFQGFLQRHPDLLPAEIEYGPVHIDNAY